MHNLHDAALEGSFFIVDLDVALIALNEVPDCSKGMQQADIAISRPRGLLQGKAPFQDLILCI